MIRKRLKIPRGFFARTWCQRDFERHGISFQPVQCNVSHNKYKGVLRGMHYQSAPHQEAKLVWCINGAIHDVIIDLRPLSPTFHATSISRSYRRKPSNVVSFQRDLLMDFRLYKMSLRFFTKCLSFTLLNLPKV